MSAEQLIAEVERQGGVLEIHGERIRYRLPEAIATTALKELRVHREAVLRALRQRTVVVPAGAALLAPRYDGVGKPLAAVPSCWCCAIPWRLERIEEWQGKSYAFLEPGCGCLGAPQALACCGLCLDHCRCRTRPREK